MADALTIPDLVSLIEKGEEAERLLVDQFGHVIENVLYMRTNSPTCFDQIAGAQSAQPSDQDAFEITRYLDTCERAWNRRSGSTNGLMNCSAKSCLSSGLPVAGTDSSRFTIEKHLGAGGCGDVFLARDQEFDRPVVIKRMRLGGN